MAAVYIFKAASIAAENIGHRNRAIQQCQKGIVHQEKTTAAGGRCRAGALSAAVEKIEEKRKPDDFFGHRKRDRTNWRQIQRSGAKPTRVCLPQPTLRTDLDIGAEKSETITVSDFFYTNFCSRIL